MVECTPLLSYKIFLVVDLHSSLTYFMMIHPLPVTGKVPIKSLVARQLPTDKCVCVCDVNGSSL